MSLAYCQCLCERLLSCRILDLAPARRATSTPRRPVPLTPHGAGSLWESPPPPSLMSVVTQGNTEGVKQALKKGADVNAPDTKGFTPLMAAADKGFTPIVQLLLEKGADANEKEPKQGKTALMLAAANGHTKAVQALLAKGADANEKDTKGLDGPYGGGRARSCRSCASLTGKGG